MNLQDKPENFTSLYARALPSERAKVPLLEFLDDESTLPIPESMVVLEYLEDLVADSGAQLSAKERSACRLYAQMFSSWLSYIPVLKATEGSSEEEAALKVGIGGLQRVA